MKDLVEQYVESLEKDNDTIKAYRLDLEKFTAAYGETKPLAIKSPEIKVYLDGLTTRTGKRVSVSTQNRHYATISCFFNWLIKQSKLIENPIKNVERRKPNKDLGETNSKDIIRYLDREIVGKIMTESKSIREEFLFDLLYSSGLRISEALALNVQDIRNGVIQVRAGKGNRARVTYMSKQTEKLFRKYLEKRVPDRSVLFQATTIEEAQALRNEGALFTTNNGTRLGYHRANQLFKQASKGIKNPDSTPLTIHQLRHTFCTERVGHIDIRVLQKLAGHSDIRTTLRYAKVADIVAREQFDKYDRERNAGFNDSGEFKLPTQEDFEKATALI
ncbi:MAG: tyrosine-type recombinase/integrase [Cyanobacteria bacterium]|nr:tyrosine-type recombinase/integrase [Cyanobacteriota bacterium]MDA1019998.1 tyrosine-type recombinase/integrase [Cyanobacteriota bacterium]